MSMGTNLKSGIIILVFVVGMVSIAAGRTIYVDDDGPADFNTIQAAIDDSNDGDTIIVADGTYTGDSNRDIEFLGKAITLRSKNGPENCIIDCNGAESEPHRGFYFHNGESADSIIEGFTITNGYAQCEGLPPPSPAGCFYLGGAIYCRVSSPTISNCIIKGNTAGHAVGGGIACFESNPTVSNCTFAGNLAYMGGGMSLNRNSDPTIINCTFSGNVAYGFGGGIHIGLFLSWANNSPKVINCIFRGDSPDEIYVFDSTPVITYSNVEGGWPDEGNIDVDPCFIEQGYWEDPCNTPTMPWDDIWIDGDYHLKSQAGRWEPESQSWVLDAVTSPCIDAGDPMSPIGFEPFPNDGVINMGAFGGTGEASKSYFGKPVCEIIVAGDVNGDCIVNYKDFALMALNWLRDENQ